MTRCRGLLLPLSLADASIADALRSGADPQRAVDGLIDLANDAGGNDNVTVVVVDPIVPVED